MEKVENGKFVSVNYTGKLENGEVFDTSEGRAPLEVQMGAGNIIKGFEDALEGMALNETKNITLSPGEAYGERNEEHVHSFPRSEVPSDMNPEVGQMVALTAPDGQQIPANISHVDDEKITVDLNHPLAGKTLKFDIEVVGISDTPTQAQGGCNCGADPSDGCSC